MHTRGGAEAEPPPPVVAMGSLLHIYRREGHSPGDRRRTCCGGPARNQRVHSLQGTDVLEMALGVRVVAQEDSSGRG